MALSMSHLPISPRVLRLFERQSRKSLYQQRLGVYAPGVSGRIPEYLPNKEAAKHGLLYEKEAIERFQALSGIRVFQVGHVVHERFDWLSCCPDGITEDGRVAEIKCPYYRQIVPGVPHYYVKQLQIAMEVTDLDEAVLVQYKPANVFGREQLMITTLARDRTWIHKNWQRLQKNGRKVWHAHRG